ncbi:MAG: hypothetical protein ABSF35_00600 [Polyangia bacterium]
MNILGVNFHACLFTLDDSPVPHEARHRRSQHVADRARRRFMTKWLDFYQPYFPSESEARRFIGDCEKSSDDAAMLIMHQAARLVTISKKMAEIQPRRDALALLFLLICAENVSKLHDDFHDEGKSRHYVQTFFSQFLSNSEKAQIEEKFLTLDLGLMSLGQIIDVLYDTRCDVVHEGKYWGFSFSSHGVPTATVETPVLTRMSIDEFRSIVVNGCVQAARGRTAD